MDSIMQDEKFCYLCGRTAPEPLDIHHCFSGSLRKKSEKYGLLVYLCHDSCHLGGAHKDAAIALYLHQQAQKAAMATYHWTLDDWRRHMLTKNFLED